MKKNPNPIWWPVMGGVGVGAGTLLLVGMLHSRQLFRPSEQELASSSDSKQ